MDHCLVIAEGTFALGIHNRDTVLGIHFSPRAGDYFLFFSEKSTPPQGHPITSNQDQQSCPVQMDDPNYD